MTHPLINFRSVQFVRHWYRNQFGVTRKTLPSGESIFGGATILSDEIAYPLLLNYPHETLRERARRMEWVDEWTPMTKFSITANRSIVFKGRKAVDMWKAWTGWIFGKK